MKLIGITGKARAGKDEIAKYLWAQHAFTRIAFADPLKLAAQVIFGLTDDQTWNPDFKEVVIPYWGLTPRQIMQRLGTEAIRGTFGADTWVKRWALGYLMLMDTDDIVVTDVRFDEEAQAIRNYGGVIIEVRRGTGLGGAEGQHASERGLSLPADIVIDNSGTIEELHAKIEAVL